LLDDHAIYVQPIDHPAVPKGTERLRFTPSPPHADANMERLIDTLHTLWSQFAPSRAVA
jgi:5-aminolevulinate synthase